MTLWGGADEKDSYLNYEQLLVHDHDGVVVSAFVAVNVDDVLTYGISWEAVYQSPTI